MTERTVDGVRPRSMRRRAALVVGAIGVTVWLLPLLASPFSEDPSAASTGDATVEGFGVVVLAVVNVLAVLVAIRRPRRGGALLLVTGVAFSLFAIATAGRQQWLAALVSGGPFIVAGVLFASAARTGRSERPRAAGDDSPPS